MLHAIWHPPDSALIIPVHTAPIMHSTMPRGLPCTVPSHMEMATPVVRISKDSISRRSGSRLSSAAHRSAVTTGMKDLAAGRRAWVY